VSARSAVAISPSTVHLRIGKPRCSQLIADVLGLNVVPPQDAPADVTSRPEEKKRHPRRPEGRQAASGVPRQYRRPLKRFALRLVCRALLEGLPAAARPSAWSDSPRGCDSQHAGPATLVPPEVAPPLRTQRRSRLVDRKVTGSVVRVPGERHVRGDGARQLSSRTLRVSTCCWKATILPPSSVNT